jgi:hypothetical protein
VLRRDQTPHHDVTVLTQRADLFQLRLIRHIDSQGKHLAGSLHQATIL